MHVVFLEFAENKAMAKDFMAGHVAWLKKGFQEEKFLLSGSLEEGRGGAILAKDMPKSEIENIINEDPFVKEGIVKATITEFSPGIADERLSFLTPAAA
ncbi:MAG: hypothetical protein MI743_19025 [Sneathiellales bacterium]|nr:hypothetical protein [Sneathiellales bacterium]